MRILYVTVIALIAMILTAGCIWNDSSAKDITTCPTSIPTKTTLTTITTTTTTTTTSSTTIPATLPDSSPTGRISMDYVWSINSNYISSKLDYHVEVLNANLFGQPTKVRIHWNWKKGMKDICLLKGVYPLSESNMKVYLSDKYVNETYIENGTSLTRKTYLFGRVPDNKTVSDLLYLSSQGFRLKNCRESHLIPSGDSGYFDVDIPDFDREFVISIGFGTSTITLSSLSNGEYTNDATPDFEFTPAGDQAEYSCEIWINDTEYGLNATSQNNTLTNITANDTLTDGGYEWYVNCTAGGTTDKSSVWSFTVETVLPRLAFVPPTPSNDSFVPTNYTQINMTIIESNLDVFIFNWNGTNITLRNYTCTENMSFLNDGQGGYCIDKYEASLWNADGTWNSTSATDAWRQVNTTAALAAGAYAGSAPGVYPWVYISQIQARTACINAGKHLCTSEEWLGAANIKGQFYDLPATITDCNVVSGSPVACQNSGPNGADACNTSYMQSCISEEGVYDMTGNVWEWCNESFTTVIPLATNSWYYINTTTMEWSLSSSADTGKYGKDGCYFGTAGSRAVFRGGYWNYGSIAGPWCASVNYAPSNAGSNIGFRCCTAPN